jgi:hypothetical protein
MKEWLEDILLQILLQRKFWIHDIGGQFYLKIFKFFCKSCDNCQKIGGLKTKSLAKLVITLLKEPFMKWGLNFKGPIKPARRLT